MDNIKDDILREVMRAKCKKTLSHRGDLVIEFAVTDRDFLQEALNQTADSGKTLESRFFRRPTKINRARRVLIYTDNGYLSYGDRTDHYHPAGIKSKALADLPIIYPFDVDDPYDTPVWFPGWAPGWRSSIPKELGEELLVNMKLVDAIAPYLNISAWQGLLMHALSRQGGGSFVRFIDVKMFDKYKQYIVQHGLDYVSATQHDSAELLALFKDVVDWGHVSTNFRFNRETILLYEEKIVWPNLLRRCMVPSDILKRQEDAGRITQWTRI